ncbi:hypothetical protein Abr02nite_27060 [Paractinoplanes brasiliensis]|nr:hypothetical protein Abr02nite_27060 [Actinoplanes brasiliensis]
MSIDPTKVFLHQVGSGNLSVTNRQRGLDSRVENGNTSGTRVLRVSSQRLAATNKASTASTTSTTETLSRPPEAPRLTL